MTQRQIILHIGAPKAGSTYLQRVMMQNQAVLLPNGVHYPQTADDHPGTGADIAALLADGPKALFAHNSHTVVLSHEDFLSRPVRTIGPLAAFATEHQVTVQVVVFLRPLSEMVYGSYSQHMKQFFGTYLEKRQAYSGHSFEEFAGSRAKNLKMDVWLKRWDSAFPDVPMVVAGHRDIRPVLTDLLPVTQPMKWDVHTTLVNKSLRVCDCEEIAAAMADSSQSNEAIKRMHRRHFHNTDLPDEGRSAERTAWLETLFATTNAALKTVTGYDNTLDAAQKTP